MAFKRSTLRYGETPQPVTPYQKAAQVWDERIGSARVQAHKWRLMALGSLALSLILAAILLWLGRSGSAVPYVVEIDPRGGARAVGPAAEAYRPSDAQIAFHLARFVENVRSLSIDPVVVRQSWFKAYDFVTDRAAVTLNEHARENDPFAKVGRETVAVEVTSVVRASDSSFQVRWLERTFEGGALKDTKRLPPRRRVGPNRVAWVASEILAWIETCPCLPLAREGPPDCLPNAPAVRPEQSAVVRDGADVDAPSFDPAMAARDQS